MSTLTVSTLAALTAAITPSFAGGTIILKDGAYGALTLTNKNPSTSIRIVAENPDKAHFTKITLTGCSNLIFENLAVWPLTQVVKTSTPKFGISGNGATHHIQVIGGKIRGRFDSDNFPKWTKADWTNWAQGGIQFAGQYNTVDGVKMVGVHFGVSFTGKFNTVKNTSVFGFSGDSFRLNNDDCTLENSAATDPVQIDANHCDGVQSFGKLVNGKYTLVKNLRIVNNQFIESTVNQNNPLRAKMQGIGLHNPPYANATILNNVVESTAFTGISVKGCATANVSGNIVRNASKIAGANYPSFDVTGSNLTVNNNTAPRFISSFNPTNVVKSF